LKAVCSDPGVVPLPQNRVDFSDIHSGSVWLFMVLHAFYFLYCRLEVKIKWDQIWKSQSTLICMEGMQVVVSLTILLLLAHSFKESWITVFDKFIKKISVRNLIAANYKQKRYLYTESLDLIKALC
jgi:hypothetical protein